MIKKTSKLMAILLMAVLFAGFGTGCGDIELKQGVYISEDGYASVVLYEDNVFSFNRGQLFSYLPTGTYSIKKRKLILHVADDEKYIFNIKNGQLIIENGQGLEHLEGMKFKLSEE